MCWNRSWLTICLGHADMVLYRFFCEGFMLLFHLVYSLHVVHLLTSLFFSILLSLHSGTVDYLPCPSVHTADVTAVHYSEHLRTQQPWDHNSLPPEQHPISSSLMGQYCLTACSLSYLFTEQPCRITVFTAHTWLSWSVCCCICSSLLSVVWHLENPPCFCALLPAAHPPWSRLCAMCAWNWCGKRQPCSKYHLQTSLVLVCRWLLGCISASSMLCRCLGELRRGQLHHALLASARLRPCLWVSKSCGRNLAKHVTNPMSIYIPLTSSVAGIARIALTFSRSAMTPVADKMWLWKRTSQTLKCSFYDTESQLDLSTAAQKGYQHGIMVLAFHLLHSL